jgi:hypothetical protein
VSLGNKTISDSAANLFKSPYLIMFRFHKIYFLLTHLLLLVEILIAAFAHDRFIRPYVGDFLVVIFLYCFYRSFFKTPYTTVAFAVLLFSYVVEVSQYFHLINRLGLQQSRLAHLILGSGFAWLDLVAYTLGIALVLLTERLRTTLKLLSSSSSH